LVIWSILPILVCFSQKNLATLCSSRSFIAGIVANKEKLGLMEDSIIFLKVGKRAVN
jgi:hypothetical protein